MKIVSPEIITINAGALFHYFPKRSGAGDKPFCLDMRNRFFIRRW